jgi:hypothetical protein
LNQTELKKEFGNRVKIYFGLESMKIPVKISAFVDTFDREEFKFAKTSVTNGLFRVDLWNERIMFWHRNCQLILDFLVENLGLPALE